MNDWTRKPWARSSGRQSGLVSLQGISRSMSDGHQWLERGRPEEGWSGHTSCVRSFFFLTPCSSAAGDLLVSDTSCSSRVGLSVCAISVCVCGADTSSTLGFGALSCEPPSCNAGGRNDWRVENMSSPQLRSLLLSLRYVCVCRCPRAWSCWSWWSW